MSGVPIVGRASCGHTPDVARLLAECDRFDAAADARAAEINRGERHGPPLRRWLTTAEVRSLIVGEVDTVAQDFHEALGGDR